MTATGPAVEEKYIGAEGTWEQRVRRLEAAMEICSPFVQRKIAEALMKVTATRPAVEER